MSLITIFKRMVDHADLMDRMMLKLGVRGKLAEHANAGSVMRRAANRCLSCEHGGECKTWLEGHDDAREAPAYCRNHDLFARLRTEIEAEAVPQTH